MNDKVLTFIVDDQRLMRLSVRRILQQDKLFILHDCSSIKDALSFLQKNYVELLIIDVYFPQSNGLDLLSYIRQRKISFDIPVIVLSGENNRNDILMALDLGATEYIVKPFEGNKFYSKICHVVEQFRNPSQITQTLRHAQKAFLLENYEESSRLFSLLCELAPGNLRFNTDMAITSHKLGQTNRSIAMLEAILIQDPTFFYAHASLADIYLELRDTEKAISYLEKELEFNGKRVHRRYLLAKAYTELGAFEKAIEHMHKAISHAGLSAETFLISMADIQQKAGHWDMALHYYLKARRYSPTCQQALDGIISTTERFGQPKQAIHHLSSLLPYKKGAYQVLLARSRVYKKLKETSLALDDINSAIRFAPHLKEAYIQKIHFFNSQGSQSEAEHHKKEVLRLFPDSADEIHVALSKAS